MVRDAIGGFDAGYVAERAWQLDWLLARLGLTSARA